MSWFLSFSILIYKKENTKAKRTSTNVKQPMMASGN